MQWDSIPNDPNDVLPVRIVNTTIARNFAEDPNEPTAGGGGVALHPASFEITNCIFDSNIASAYGAAVYATGPEGDEPSGVLTNDTFESNKSTYGTALSVISGTDPNDPIVFLNNSIAWDGDVVPKIEGPVEVNYSDVNNLDPNTPGTGNIDQPPLFCSPGDGRFELDPNSPCIDAGLDALVANDNADVDDDSVVNVVIPWDRIRFERQLDAIAAGQLVDMGALEYPLSLDFDPECPWDLNGDGTVGLADLALVLSFYATPGASECFCLPADFDCDGDVDLQDLAVFLSHFGTNCPEGFARGGDNPDMPSLEFIEWAQNAAIWELLEWRAEWESEH